MTDLTQTPSSLQAPGIIQQASELLQGRRTRGEVLGRRRKSTRTVYKDAWGNFGAFLRFRHSGDKTDLSRWAKRNYVPEEQLAYLEANIPRVTHHDVQAYKTALLNLPTKRGIGLANSTITGRLAALVHLFKVALREGVIETNPASQDYVDRLPHQHRRKLYVPTLKEVKTVLATYAAVDTIALRNRMLFKLIAWTGIRREEAAELYLGDFERQEDDVRMTVHRGKGDKERSMILHRGLESDLAYYIDELKLEGPLFPSMCRSGETITISDKPLTPDAISHIIYTMTLKTLDRPYSPHKLRHFFATATHDAGASIENIQEALGHEDPRTTRGYIQRRLTRTRSAAELLDLGKEQ